MCNWLDLFWEWSGMTPEKYSTEGMNQNKGEFEDDDNQGTEFCKS